eukprot:3916826-Amphidinium_carterae.1
MNLICNNSCWHCIFGSEMKSALVWSCEQAVLWGWPFRNVLVTSPQDLGQRRRCVSQGES